MDSSQVWSIHHTGQNVVDLRGAVNQIATLLPLRKTVKLLNNPREKSRGDY